MRTFDLLYIRHFLLPFIVKRLWRHRFVIHTEMPKTRQRYRETAFAHAAVIPQTALVYVRMDQRVHDGHPFVLHITLTQNRTLIKRTKIYNGTRYPKLYLGRLLFEMAQFRLYVNTYRVEN